MTKKELVAGLKWYKVIRKDPYNGNLTGGHTQFDYAEALPTKGKPGQWLKHPTRQKLEVCRSGFHVTYCPYSWGATNTDARVFTVEIKGDIRHDGTNKIACRAIRLVKEVKKGTTAWARITDVEYQHAKFQKLRKHKKS